MPCKVLCFLLLFCFYALGAKGQTYYQVTATSGSQIVNGTTVSVTMIGNTGSITQCGVSPYITTMPSLSTTISGYKFAFSHPSTAVRSHLLAVDYDDTISVFINGIQYNISSANLSPFAAGNCVCNQTPTIIGGTLTGINGFHACAQFDVDPGYPIDSIEILGIHPYASGVVFDFYFYSDCPGNVVASSSYDTLCINDTLYLFADTNSVSTSATYSWAGPNGFTSVLQNPVINNVSILDSGIYTVTATDTCIYTSSVHITVNTAPSFTVSSNSPLCPGDSLDLSVSSISGAIYHWAGPNNFSSAVQNPSITSLVMADTGNYKIKVTNNGCSDSVITHVIVYDPGTAIAGSSTPVCAGDSLKLSASSASPGVSYSWMGPNSFNSVLQNPAIANAQTNNSGIYTLTVSLNGCSSSTSTNVIINPVLGTPVITIAVSPSDTICAGGNITLSAIAANAGSTPTYQWKRNGINIGGATAASFTTSSVSNGDIITCKVTSTAPCQAVDTAISNALHMHVLLIPPPVVTVSVYPLQYVPGDTVTFSGHVPAGSTGLSFQWTKNGVHIAGATSPTYTSSNLSINDTICLIVHSSVPCTFPDSTITCTELTTGVNSLSSSIGGLHVYPNPNNGSFTVSGTLPNCKSANIEIFNLLGQLVYQEEQKIENGVMNKQINMDAQTAGVYMLFIKTDREIRASKLIVNP